MNRYDWISVYGDSHSRGCLVLVLISALAVVIGFVLIGPDKTAADPIKAEVGQLVADVLEVGGVDGGRSLTLRGLDADGLQSPVALRITSYATTAPVCAVAACDVSTAVDVAVGSAGVEVAVRRGRHFKRLRAAVRWRPLQHWRHNRTRLLGRRRHRGCG